MATVASDRISRASGRRAWRSARGAVTALFVLLIASIIPWRPDAIYSGGVDAVVIAKAVLAVVALTIATGLAARAWPRVPVGLGPAVVMGFTLILSVLGSTLSASFGPTVVLVVRVVIVMSTVLMLLSVIPGEQAIGALLRAMALVALVAAITGAPTFAATGRLGGGIPEIHPNELGGLVAPPLIGLFYLTLRRGAHWTWSIAMAILAAILLASGSRTAMLGVAVALIVAVAVVGIRHRSVLYAALVALPVGYALITLTGVVAALATRGGTTDETAALEARADGWAVVLGWPWDAWERWIGLGLSVKEITVDLEWRDTQVLDSSWISLLAQTGVLGTLLMAGLVMWCLIAAITSDRRRGLVLPLLAVALVRSATESGLLDSAMLFLLFFTLASTLTRRSRHAGAAFASAEPARPR